MASSEGCPVAMALCLTDGQRARWLAFGLRVRCVGSEHGAGLPQAGPCHYAFYLLWLKSLRSASLRKCLLLTTFKNKFFRHNRSLGEGKSLQAGICLQIEDLKPWAPWVVGVQHSAGGTNTSTTHRSWSLFSRGAQDNRS